MMQLTMQEKNSLSKELQCTKVLIKTTNVNRLHTIKVLFQILQRSLRVNLSFKQKIASWLAVKNPADVFYTISQSWLSDTLTVSSINNSIMIKRCRHALACMTQPEGKISRLFGCISFVLENPWNVIFEISSSHVITFLSTSRHPERDSSRE